MTAPLTVRVDRWVWTVRLAPTRARAATACRAGHVRVNGVRAKPSTSVRIGDEVHLRGEGRERKVVVTKLLGARVGAPVAIECYEDHSPPPPTREDTPAAVVRDRGSGRPTKRERRQIEALRGH